MNRIFPLFFILVILSFGCGKTPSKASKTEPTNSSGVGNPVTAPTDYLGALNKAQKSATRQIDVTGVKQAIQMFKSEEERYPTTLNELVSKQYIRALPEAPSGMKYTYNPQTGEVKVVPQ